MPYENHFDLKCYPRSLKSENPQKKKSRETQICKLGKGIMKSQNHSSRGYKWIASQLIEVGKISCPSQPKFDKAFLCKLTKKSGENRIETSQSSLRGNIQKVSER